MTDIMVRVVDHNLGGGSTNGTGYYSDGTAPVGSVERPAQKGSVHIVTLQECMRSVFDAWVARGWYGVFIPMTTADENKFRGNEDKGQAILSRYPITDTDVVALPLPPAVDSKKEFNLICARIEFPGFEKVEEELWVATTHLWSAGIDPTTGQAYTGSTNDLTRSLQASAINNYLGSRISGKKRWILTGDLNTGPKSPAIDYLHRLYRDGTIGPAKFWEGDQFYRGVLERNGRPTVSGRKIDYFFVSHRGVDPVHGVGLELVDALPNGGDCHKEILFGTAIFTGLTLV